MRFIRSQHVVLPEAVQAACIGIRAGKIVSVGAFEDVPAGAPLTDYGTQWILPGLVDTHVHINDPGRTSWEGFQSATQAALSGGVTTLVDMPLNSIPPTTTMHGVTAKLRAMEGTIHCDVGLTGGLVPQNADTVGELVREGLLAAKCFLAESGVDEFPHVNAEALARGLRSMASVGAPLFVHAELPEPLERAAERLGLVSLQDVRRYQTYLQSRPKEAEDAAIELVFKSLAAHGGRAHIVHLSSSTALPILQRALDGKIALTAETCPHYLTLAAEDVPDGATAFKCAPPIRESANRDALWKALGDGLLAQIVTDHSPSTLDLKCSDSGDFMKAWGGISSLEIGLSVCAEFGRARGLQFEQIVRWMSAEPAALVGLSGRKGSIAVGLDADFCIWDPQSTFTVEAKSLKHKNAITPYEARVLHGRIVQTTLRGEVVFDRFRAEPYARASGIWQKRT
jgi:allantoinase